MRKATRLLSICTMRDGIMKQEQFLNVVDRDEAERRFSEIERGEVQTIPWMEVRARVFRR